MQKGKKCQLRNRWKCWVLSTARLLQPKFPPVGASHQQERSFFSITLTISSVLMEANHTEQPGRLLEKFWVLGRIYTYRYVLKIGQKYIYIYMNMNISSAARSYMGSMQLPMAKFHLSSKSCSKTCPKNVIGVGFFKKPPKNPVKMASVDASPALTICWRCFTLTCVGIGFPASKF